MSKEEVERLKSRKQRIQRNAAELRAEAAELDDKARLLQERISASGRRPHVSDHALVRWLQRVEGFDVEALHRKILTPEIKDQIAAIGSGSIRLRSGRELVIRNRCVITVK